MWPATYRGGGSYEDQTIRTALIKRIVTGFFDARIAPRQIQHYWYGNLLRHHQCEHIFIDRAKLLSHVLESAVVLVKRNLGIRTIAYERAGVYLDFALSMKERSCYSGFS